MKKKRKSKKPSWESKELHDIDRYWERPWISREGARQSSIKRTSARQSNKRSRRKA